MMFPPEPERWSDRRAAGRAFEDHLGRQLRAVSAPARLDQAAHDRIVGRVLHEPGPRGRLPVVLAILGVAVLSGGVVKAMYGRFFDLPWRHEAATPALPEPGPSRGGPPAAAPVPLPLPLPAPTHAALGETTAAPAGTVAPAPARRRRPEPRAAAVLDHDDAPAVTAAPAPAPPAVDQPAAPRRARGACRSSSRRPPRRRSRRPRGHSPLLPSLPRAAAGATPSRSPRASCSRPPSD